MRERYVPKHNMVLCEMIEPKRTSGGLHLPGAQKDDNSVRGRVLEVGPGTWQGGVFVPVTAKIGDIVLADWSQGFNVGVNGIGMVPETAILCTIENPTDGRTLAVKELAAVRDDDDDAEAEPEPEKVLQ